MTGESGASDGNCEDASDTSSASTVSSCGDDADGVLDKETPPDDARETMAADDDEKFRNIARIESALEIFGVLVDKIMCVRNKFNKAIVGKAKNVKMK